MPPHSLTSTFPSSLPTFSHLRKPHLLSPNRTSILKTPSFIPKSSLLSVSTTSPSPSNELLSKPSPAENSRTIMELSLSGTLSTVTHDGWPIGIGAQFVVDAQGSPALCLKEPGRFFALDGHSSFHVQLEQSRSRTAQCTVIGRLRKPEDGLRLRKLYSKWEKKFGEELDQALLFEISVERVLQIEDFKEEGIWVSPSDYLNAEPDPLRNFAEKIVNEMNSQHAEDVQRLCKVFVDSEFQVTDTKIVWVDRLGFDLYIYSEKGVFAARIPFPREVVDEKAVKSSFNCMSHLAWEIEKSYVAREFEKVKNLKRIR